MKRDEAIKILKSKMDGSIDTSYEWAETIRMAIEALHDAEWIPVSEGLPKKNDEYLVTVLIPIQDYNNVYYEESDIMFLSFHHGKFFDEFDTTDYHNFVTAWMPKPKPYRKDDE